MKKTAIIPSGLQSYYDDWQMSPGLACGDFVFFTGFTGKEPDGTLPADPETQMRQAFLTAGKVLKKADMTFGNVVEMTSYHVGLRAHLDLFKTVRSDFIQEPYPAWTAIEVAGFVSENAIIEIRLIAHRNS